MNVKYVASYNWIEAEKPRIIVPGVYNFVLHVCFLISIFIAGSPTIWSGSRFPFTLQPDDDFVYADCYVRSCPNIRCCHFWLLRTRYIARRCRYLWPTVDVIADRKNLRKLLRWHNPTPGKEVRDFGIDVQLVEAKTLAICGQEGPENEV